MKEFVHMIAVGCLIVATIGPQQTAAMYDNICRLHKNGTQLRDPYSCAGYIVCIDSTEVKYTCPDGHLYSIAEGKCIVTDAGCENPCAPDYDGMWAADPKSCKGYYYCRNGTSLFGMCPDNLHFDEDEQKCVHARDSLCENDEYCHITPDGTQFMKPDSCTGFYTCKKGALTKSTCAKGKAFNKETGSCVDEKTVIGCENYCSGVKNKFVSDSKTCRGYFYCADKGNVQDLNPVGGKCAEGTFFDSDAQSCVDPIHVKCAYDRCDGRPDIFVNSGTNCMYYLTCRNGTSIREKLCTGNTFFDEKRQVCTNEVITYKACIIEK